MGDDIIGHWVVQKKMSDNNWTLNYITKMGDDMFGYLIILQKWWQYDLIKVIMDQRKLGIDLKYSFEI
jgi:hypothetical protein